MRDYKRMICKCFENKVKDNYANVLKKRFHQYKFICIFGCGNIGQGTLNDLVEEGIKVDFFCDNDTKKVGQIYNNVKCISVDELREKKDETIVIIATRYYKDIYNQLSKLGFSNLDRIFTNKFAIDDYMNNNLEDTKTKIFKLIDILGDDESRRIVYRLIEEWNTYSYKYGQLDNIHSENQYFCENIINLSENEVFVDGGAYIGDTIEQFLQNCNYRFNKIISFELNKNNYEKLNKNINNFNYRIKKKIVALNKGLSNKKMNISYNDKEEGSYISEDGVIKGETTTIDSELKNEMISFIKMDIEGSELEALHGAKNIIKKCKPKLAICIYHKPQDLWEIPFYIKEILPEYKIFIRHHTDLLNETVCYAILD